MQLIITDAGDSVQYYDKIRLRIDSRRTKEHLIIMPSEEENDFIYITFKRNYVHQAAFQRLLCIDECDNDSRKYVIIFANVEKCIEFIASIKNGKVKDKLRIAVSNDVELFKAKYLIPLATACQEDSSMEEEIQPLLLEFLQFYKTKYEKETSSQHVDDASVATNTLHLNLIAVSKNEAPVQGDKDTASENNGITVTKISNLTDQNDDESNERRKSLRKRLMNVNYHDGDIGKRPLKRSLSTKEHQQRELAKAKPLDKNIIYEPNFKLHNFIQNGISKSRLFIFPNSDEILCYQYFYSSRDKYYLCAGCRKANKRTPAIIEKDSSGKDFVKCLRNDHICELRQFQPEKFQSEKPIVNDESKIIQKPMFKLFQRQVQGKMRKKLAIFNSTDLTMCHEYTCYRGGSKYICHPCKNYFCIHVYARIIKNGNEEEEYVQMGNNDHKCNLKKFFC